MGKSEVKWTQNHEIWSTHIGFKTAVSQVLNASGSSIIISNYGTNTSYRRKSARIRPNATFPSKSIPTGKRSRQHNERISLRLDRLANLKGDTEIKLPCWGASENITVYQNRFSRLNIFKSFAPLCQNFWIRFILILPKTFSDIHKFNLFFSIFFNLLF